MISNHNEDAVGIWTPRNDDDVDTIPAVSALVPRSLDLATRALPQRGSFTEGLKGLGLDWSVSKHQLWRQVGVGPQGRPQMRAAENTFEVRRDDTLAMLGVVGRRYETVQNSAMTKSLDEIFSGQLAGMATLERGGGFDGGATVYMQAALPPNLTRALFKGADVIAPYLAFTTSHDGSSALRVFPTAVRVICQNTLRMAISGERKAKAGWTFRHTRKAASAQAQMTAVLRESARAYVEHMDRMQTMASASITASKVKVLIADEILLGEDTPAKRRKVQTIVDLVDNGRGTEIPGVRGTRYGVFQAVTEFANHYAPVSRALPAPDAAARRLERVLFDHVDFVERAEAVLLR